MDLVAYFGGKCSVCGYDRCIEAFDFHHVDPKTKKFGLGHGSTWSFDSMLEEAKKCVMLCANCHREVEAGITSIAG